MIITVELVVIIMGPVGLVVGIVLWFFHQIRTLRNELGGEISQNHNDITSHKLFAAERYVTKSGLTESLNRVHDSVDHLTDRIDELLKRMGDK